MPRLAACNPHLTGKVRSRNWEKGQSVWGQKFNQKPIEDENSLINIIQHIADNHIKHTERWGEQLITTWEKGLPEKSLTSLKAIIEESCTSIDNLFNLSRCRMC